MDIDKDGTKSRFVMIMTADKDQPHLRKGTQDFIFPYIFTCMVPSKRKKQAVKELVGEKARKRVKNS